MQVGAPDESLTRFSGLAAVTELCERLGVIDRLDARIGPIKTRERGFTAGQVLVGRAAAQLSLMAAARCPCGADAAARDPVSADAGRGPAGTPG